MKTYIKYDHATFFTSSLQVSFCCMFSIFLKNRYTKRLLATGIFGLPFTVNKSTAEETFSEYFSFLYDTSFEDTTAISECYVPFYTAEVRNVSSTFAGEYAIKRR